MRASSIVIPPRLRFVLVLFAALLAAWGVRGLATVVLAAKLRHLAASRHLDVAWRALAFDFPADVNAAGLVVTTHAAGDTVARIANLHVAVAPLSLLLFHPTPAAVELSGARFVSPPRADIEADSLAEEAPPDEKPGRGPVADKVRRAANDAVRLLLLPARRMPRLTLRAVSVESRATDDAPARVLHVDWLDFANGAHGVALAAAGGLGLDQPVGWDARLAWDRDDRLRGLARLRMPDPDADSVETLRLVVDGRVAQDRRAGEVRIADSTRVSVGQLVFLLGGRVARAGPSVAFHLAADRLTERAVFASLPAPVLGPLRDLAVNGAWDYRLTFALDLAHPDDVSFDADVIPHGLQIDDERSRLHLVSLEDPFVARIHLPHDRIVERDLSDANPHFLTLDRMDSILVHAVVTNEDGGFFRHHGFNTEAVKASIAANLRAGAYKRGAGTITMQLARNLYLGHERTLSRKGQEVTLAWILEHLSYVTKRRLLEIYLNIIEWGPDVHGADEAASYYFGTTAKRLTVAQSLFLTTVIPAPTKWKYRFAKDGTLRPFERAEMHFIGRAMVAKGWLTESELPAADSLAVEITGPARAVLFPDAATAGGP